MGYSSDVEEGKRVIVKSIHSSSNCPELGELVPAEKSESCGAVDVAVGGLTAADSIGAVVEVICSLLDDCLLRIGTDTAFNFLETAGEVLVEVEPALGLSLASLATLSPLMCDSDVFR